MRSRLCAALAAVMLSDFSSIGASTGNAAGATVFSHSATGPACARALQFEQADTRTSWFMARVTLGCHATACIASQWSAPDKHQAHQT